MNIKQAFGFRIKTLRQERHLSQENFALQINMDRTYLASIETGKRNVSLENIRKLADGFELTLAELFYGIDLERTDYNGNK